MVISNLIYTFRFVVDIIEITPLFFTDDSTAKQLVTIIHDCEKASDAVEEACSRTLEVSKCFRTKIHELQWAPSFEVMMQELMTAG